MKLRHTLGFLHALVATAMMLHAGNSPQFHGPTAQGVSTEENPPLNWSATENVAWKAELPGESWSSPVVWADRVFVTTATDSGGSCHVLSLDRKTGKTLWDTEVFKQVQRRKQARNTLATPTLATDGERVYAAFNDGSFVALNYDGSLAWETCGKPFLFTDENPVIIGGNTNTQGRKWVDCFHGPIDQVRLYDRALSGEAVLDLVEMGATGSNPK